MIHDLDLADFVAKVNALIRPHYDTPTCTSVGRRYVRIFHLQGGQHICWGWVDRQNGDVYRGGWKKPDTRYGAHANIFAEDIAEKIEWTGPKYKKLRTF